MKKGSKMTLEQRTNVSRGHKGQIPWTKGKHHSEESNMKNRLAHLGKSPWNKGKKYSSPKISASQKRLWSNPEYVKGMSEAHKGQHSSPKTEFKKGQHFSLKTEFKKGLAPWIKGRKHSEETRKKIGRIGKGKPAWNKGINFPEDSERIEWQIEVAKSSRERLLKLYESGTFPRQVNTKPEREIKEELLKRGYKEGLDFIHQYKFNNKFMCDFCFPKQKLIIECDGDYWHMKPNSKYSKNLPNEAQKRTLKIDKSKEAYIMKVDNSSWTLLRFWESDIKKDVSLCVDKIEDVLNSKRQI